MNCLLAIVLASIAAPAPERVVLQTTAGGMIIALYPSAAPRTVAQFERLVRAGVYDGVSFFRVDPGFVVQTGVAEDRERPLSEKQSAVLGRIPLERNNLQHVRGRLSMSHPGGDPDGAISAFAMLLGTAPQLDGEYAVFGEVEEGFDVLDEIASVPTNDQHRPLVYVGIRHAVVVQDLEDARRIRWPRQSLFSSVVAASERGIRKEIAALVASMIFCTMALAALGRSVGRRWNRAARMLVLLLGGFGLVVALLPIGQRMPLLGGAAFLALVSLFKAMNRFEVPSDRDPSPPRADGIAVDQGT